jgi:predicted RNA-binding Zn ribbon-like protein
MEKTNNPFVTRGFGASENWLDLVNSELWDGFGNFTDMLDEPAWMSGFMKFWRFRVPLEPAPTREFKALRKLLRYVVQLAESKGRLRMEQVEMLNEWLKVPSIMRLVEDQNGLRLAMIPDRSGWPVILANIASSFAESLVAQEHKRLKICSNEGCKWVFIDRTRGNVRRWCSNATCGNRARVRKARAGE